MGTFEIMLPDDMLSKLRAAFTGSGGRDEEAIKLALKLGSLIMKIDELKNQNEFLSERVKFMEESIPQLETELVRIRKAIAQAKKDRELMLEILDRKSSES